MTIVSTKIINIVTDIQLPVYLNTKVKNRKTKIRTSKKYLLQKINKIKIEITNQNNHDMIKISYKT